MTEAVLKFCLESLVWFGLFRRVSGASLALVLTVTIYYEDAVFGLGWVHNIGPLYFLLWKWFLVFVGFLTDLEVDDYTSMLTD